jgi:hypothetical protein
VVVLARPDIPLHTNGSERDIRCHVTKRKISGGTRSDIGRDCRDAFLGLVKIGQAVHRFSQAKGPTAFGRYPRGLERDLRRALDRFAYFT